MRILTVFVCGIFLFIILSGCTNSATHTEKELKVNESVDKKVNSEQVTMSEAEYLIQSATSDLDSVERLNWAVKSITTLSGYKPNDDKWKKELDNIILQVSNELESYKKINPPKNYSEHHKEIQKGLAAEELFFKTLKSYAESGYSYVRINSDITLMDYLEASLKHANNARNIVETYRKSKIDDQVNQRIQ
ncbi:hypothetical protein [Heliorestis convoluta]|uniref:Putative membrane protein n=1 Tax=Heliorestis convoluta TaxID=356322 RepID=A0A5Q2MVU5_9FIRM|nr:hypothetical protein [Heliorestis convoluta]QGG46377.1 putative membrane protein [Heliorestis convoluta]